MHFVLDQSPTFSAKVKFSVPAAGAEAARSEGEFSAVFKRMSQDDIDALLAPPAAGTLRAGATDAMVCQQVMSGWAGVTDAAGAAIPFSAEALERLLLIRGMATLIAMAFLSEGMALPRKN